MALKRILLIISGGIAAYKTPEIIRLFHEKNIKTRCILTSSGAQFVTPLTLQTISEEKVYENLFSLTDENKMGHIRLSREADAILVAPAGANIIACMAHGIADDLATTTLLATKKPISIAPAMNHQMWDHPATKKNIKILNSRNVSILGPEEGSMACGEYGMGRMLDPTKIVSQIEGTLNTQKPLSGLRAIVTSGPTFEMIDVIRYIGNRSTGKQGHAIAIALAKFGAITKLISGPTHQPDPDGVETIHVNSGKEMLDACKRSLPADIAICAAAVSDWRAKKIEKNKLKKISSKKPPIISFTENPDILATLSQSKNKRPSLVVGFAAETENIIANGTKKRSKKGCDWLLANDISINSRTIGGDNNQIHLISKTGVDSWPIMSKQMVGENLAREIAQHFKNSQ